MILVIIIVWVYRVMLRKTLCSGWGMLIPGLVIVLLSTMGLSVNVWRGMIVCGLLLSGAMIWHRRLRHFVLLPSCIALTGAMVLIIMNVKLMN